MEAEGNAYITMEKEGVVLEKMRHLKQTRGGGAKAEFTKGWNEVRELLRGYDVTAVSRAADGMYAAMNKFRCSCEEYSRLLVEETERTRPIITRKKLSGSSP